MITDLPTCEIANEYEPARGVASSGSEGVEKGVKMILKKSMFAKVRLGSSRDIHRHEHARGKERCGSVVRADERSGCKSVTRRKPCTVRAGREADFDKV